MKYELTVNSSSAYDSNSLDPLAALMAEKLGTPTSACLEDTDTGEALIVMEQGDIIYLDPNVTVGVLRDLCAVCPESGKMLVCQGLVAFKGDNSPTAKATYDALMGLHVELFGPINEVDMMAASLALLLGSL